MKRLVFKGRCDLLARCAIRFVCLAMCLMYSTFGALAQHNTTCCKQTMGFPYMFYSSSPRHFQHTRTSLSGCSEAQPSDFPCHVRLNMCINTHVSRAVSCWGWGVYGENGFPLQVVRPPAVLASPLVQSRSVAKPGRPLPAPVQRSKVPTCTTYRAASLVAPPPPLALSPGLR